MAPEITHWPRWIFASACKYFKDAISGSLALIFEGQDMRAQGKDYGEFRLDGPYLTELSKDYWRCYIEINILVHSTKDSTDWHRIQRSVGTVVAAFADNFQVFRLGSGDDDDDSLLGCMKLISDEGLQGARGKRRIQVSHFGQIKPSAPLLQASVEGHYEMLLSL